MPDFERITDSLSVYAARTPTEKAYARGVIAGKKRARIEVATLVAIGYFVVVVIGKLSQ